MCLVFTFCVVWFACCFTFCLFAEWCLILHFCHFAVLRKCFLTLFPSLSCSLTVVSHVSFFLLFSRSNTGFVVFQLLKCVVFIEFPNITDRSEVFHPLPAKKRELFVVSVLPVWAFIYPVCHYTLVFSRSPYRVFQYTPALALFVLCSSGHIPSPKYSPFAVLLCFYFVGFLCGFRLVLVFCVLAYP